MGNSAYLMTLGRLRQLKAVQLETVGRAADWVVLCDLLIKAGLVVRHLKLGRAARSRYFFVDFPGQKGCFKFRVSNHPPVQWDCDYYVHPGEPASMI